MSEKTPPPKKLSKKQQTADLKGRSKELNSLIEEESGLPSTMHVIHTKTRKKFKVNRDYYLTYQGLLEPDEEYYESKDQDDD